MGKHEYDETSGTVRLNPRTAALLWAILISTLGGGGFIMRMDARVENLQRSVEAQGRTLHDHCTLDGHPVALQKTQDAIRRIDKLEQKTEVKP